MYLYTITVNARLDKELLTTAADRYTLSERFQVVENIKATRVCGSDARRKFEEETTK